MPVAKVRGTLRTHLFYHPLWAERRGSIGVTGRNGADTRGDWIVPRVLYHPGLKVQV